MGVDVVNPGIYPKMSFAEYLAIPAVSMSSILSPAARSMKHAKYSRDNDRKDTPALSLGRTGHVVTLEPGRLEREFVIAPKVDRRTKAGKAEWAEFLATVNGRSIIGEVEYDTAREMRDAVWAHPDAADLLTGARTEVSVVWREKGLLCKARFDILNGSRAADLKSARDIAPWKFAAVVHGSYNYHVAAVHYTTGWHILTGERLSWHWIAVESAPPWDVAVYWPSELTLDAAEDAREKLMIQWGHAVKVGEYPGQCPSAMELPTPRWAVPQDEIADGFEIVTDEEDTK